MIEIWIFCSYALLHCSYFTLRKNETTNDVQIYNWMEEKNTIQEQNKCQRIGINSKTTIFWTCEPLVMAQYGLKTSMSIYSCNQSIFNQ